MERNYVSVTLCIPKFLHNPRNLPRLFPKLVFFGYSAEAAERTMSGRRNGSRWNAINSGAFASLARQHCLRASRVPSAHSSIANATHRGPRNEHSNFTGVVTFTPRRAPWRVCLSVGREQSVIDRLRSASKLPRMFAKTNRFKNSFICYSSKCLVWMIFKKNYLSDCVIQPSSCHITINWLIDWLILFHFFSLVTPLKSEAGKMPRSARKLFFFSESEAPEFVLRIRKFLFQ